MSHGEGRDDVRTDDGPDDGGANAGTSRVSDDLDLSGSLEAIEAFLLGNAPSLTRVEVAARAGVPLDLAQVLWQLLGFVRLDDDDVAFTESDVEALKMSAELMRLGVISEDSQAALVRTWGRSYARLAEWQASLLGDFALEANHDAGGELDLIELASTVLPRVEALQSYVWRRHLNSAIGTLVAHDALTTSERSQAVCFVDIVGYTTRSKSLAENELVAWIERFEQEATETVTERGGRVIKTIGDEILFAADDVHAVAEVAVELTTRGMDDDDDFPAVRAGIAFGPVTSRLGDVFGPTVNVASRLTSVARPGTVVVDRGAYDALSGVASDPDAEHEHDDSDDDNDNDERHDEGESPYRFRRIRRVSVKGYGRLAAWRLTER